MAGRSRSTRAVELESVDSKIKSQIGGGELTSLSNNVSNGLMSVFWLAILRRGWVMGNATKHNGRKLINVYEMYMWVGLD